MAELIIEKPFGKTLVRLGDRYANLVVVDADLQRATETSFFQAKFPDRYFNVGVAEANMVGISIGLALSGKTVFCGTFACFASQRVGDQVAIMAHVNADVKLLGIEPALSSGHNGATHQGMLDLAVMRAMPNMTVFDPGDATETIGIMEYMLGHPGPAYIRVPRRNAPVIIEPESYQFQAGKAKRVREGCEVAIIACGIMLPRAMTAADQLAQEGISARVVSMASIKPIDENEIISAARDLGCIVTAENHTIMGGLGSAVAEVVTQYCPVPVIRVGVTDCFGEIGPVNWLAEKYGISSSHIVAASKKALEAKDRLRHSSR
jgi:transketolase